MTRIYFDSMMFVYLFEHHAEYGKRVKHIVDTIAARGHSLCTSVFTVGEVLTGPYRKSAEDVASIIRNAMRPPVVDLLPFDAESADLYARIRGRHRVSPADAVHLASAARCGVSLFLTNDRALTSLSIPGIDFIAGLNVNLF